VPTLPNEKKIATDKSDIFSAAVTVYSVLVAQGLVDPSDENYVALAGSQIYYSHYLKLNEDRMHPGLYSLLNQMLSYDAEDRPTARQIIESCKQQTE
jgi:hypothetical protein